MDLLKFIIELDVSCYLIMIGLIKINIGLNILQVKKVLLQIALIVIFEISKLIHIILYRLKKYVLFIML